MMNNAKRAMLYILTTAILTMGLAACNRVPENEIATATPTGKPTATVQATVTPEATETPQTSDILENYETPATTAETVDQSATVAPTSTVDSDAQSTASTTPEPSATRAATVKPTSTQKPTSTVKPSATKAPTKKPTATKTPTATPKKTATPTKKPTATKTATPKPTATAQKDVYQTIEFEGKTYKVLMGRNGNPNLIKDYSTLPKTLQAYAYPTFDKEAIIRDIYTYAKTVGFTSFGYAQDVMTEDLSFDCSWSSPTVVAYLGDSAYTDKYYTTEVDDIIAQREGNFSMVDFLALQNIDTLCLWIRDYGDSSYRKTYWDNGLYNGKVTKEYAMYFMFGWPLEVPYYKW